jgi:uncharacterized membrane protein YjfL (UPF0719 family)
MLTDWMELLQGAAFLTLALVILAAAKLIYDFCTPYLLEVQLAKHDNPALAVSFCGYVLGVTAVFIGTYLGPSEALVTDLIRVAGWSLGGVVLLNLSRVINDRFILPEFSNVKESIEDRNVGTGVVQAGSYLGSGFLVAGAVHGQGGGVLTALVFFAAGQLVMILFARLYGLLVPYDVHAAIEADNAAAGIPLGGALTAIGIVLAHAAGGAFTSWAGNFRDFAFEAVAVLLLLPLVRLGFDKIVLPRIPIHREISEDRNYGVALLEATAMIAFATVLTVLLG